MRYEEARKLLKLMRSNAADVVIPGLDLALNVLDMAAEPAEVAEDTAKQKKTIPKKAAPKKAKITFKPKKCPECGKEYTPRWAAQRMCDDCKKAKEALKDAAYEVAALEG